VNIYQTTQSDIPKFSNLGTENYYNKEVNSI